MDLFIKHLGEEENELVPLMLKNMTGEGGLGRGMVMLVQCFWILVSRPPSTHRSCPSPSIAPAEEEQIEVASSFMAAKAKAPLMPQPQAAA